MLPGLIIGILAILIMGAFAMSARSLSRLGYAKGGGRVVVRCRDGHLFTTIWIPLISFKAVRLGMTRFQRCPVGEHWTLVTPVDTSTLTEEEKRFAAAHPDSLIP
ncbi:MAG TPA: hypothetical protein VF829_00430 [Candidatus Paceibacterota bacterium]